MTNNKKIGVFLCQCGQRIDPKVDLKGLEEKVSQNPLVEHVSIEPFPCMTPGLETMRRVITEKGLNRVVIAGCAARIMLGKMERELAQTGLVEGSIDMVNLRDHVANVHDLDREQMAEKGLKLINAAVAGMEAFVPVEREQVDIKDPVLIVGGGVAGFAAAKYLAERNMESVITLPPGENDDMVTRMHQRYPGEVMYHERYGRLVEYVDNHPLISKETVGDVVSLLGRVGEYEVTFAPHAEGEAKMIKAGLILACLDGEFRRPDTRFGYDGKNVISLNEAQERLLEKHVMPGDVVFWVNDHDAGTPEFSYLSAKSAWAMAQQVRGASATANITILYNHEMRVPLSGQERVLSRKLGIKWQPYSPGFTTTVQAKNLTYCDPVTHLEEELHFETLVISPVRIVGTKATQTAQALGLHLSGGEFVKPELAGSALTPCDLRESLRMGRKIAEEAAELVGKAKAGDLYAPAMICSVDPEKCIGCGLCREICECGGIEAVEGMGGNIPRRVDPMQCTGGGTCAAACPYEALSLRNNTNDQREARIEALSKAMAPGEIPAFGCRWGGFAAADIAGVKGMHYNPSVHMLRVGCIGQLDPSVMAKAFISGANGLLLVGCAPEACHHSFGLDHTWSRVNLMRKLLELAGLDRRRIVLAHADMNEPEEFIRTVEAYTARMNELGPINRTPQVEERLQAMYLAVKNARVRWVLGASLRRPWEEGFPGDQHNAMDYDQNLLEVVVEEFTKGRVANLLAGSAEPRKAGDLAASLDADVGSVVESLQEMASQGMVERTHRKGDAYYSIRTLN